MLCVNAQFFATLTDRYLFGVLLITIIFFNRYRID